MGLDIKVRFSTSEIPSWPAIRDELAKLGESVRLRMIDGLPAFPDEVPEPGWRELRVGLFTGMVTIRRANGSLTCVVWGNSNPALQVGWKKVIYACAKAGSGQVETAEGPQDPDDFLTHQQISL
jgi:hypothetical protein